MQRYAFAPLALIAVLALAGCGPSEKELAAEAADLEACATAMGAFADASAIINDDITGEDAEPIRAIAVRLSNAAESASAAGEMQGVIQDAADALDMWADSGMALKDDGIPLVVDGPMWKLEVSCTPGKE